MKGLVLLFSLLMGSALAQSSMKPFIKMTGAVGAYDGGNIIALDLGVAAGLHLDDHLNVQVGVNNVKPLYGQLEIVTISISPFYRILQPKYKVSPVIGMDVGTQIWSNGNGRYINSDYRFTGYTSSSSNSRYNRGLFFGKVKLLADFKIKAFNIMVGPTFNLMYFKIEEVGKNWFTGEDYSVTDAYIDERRGFGAEFSLMYTFPMKKRAAKATSDE